MALPAGGGEPRALTDGAGFDVEAAWSPDGTRIAWISRRLPCGTGYQSCRDTVEVMRADGSDQRAIHAFADTQPRDLDWSPDGREIAAVTSTGVVALAADGSGQRRLTSYAYGFPSWSPDGTRIAVQWSDGPKVPVTVNIVDIATGRTDSLVAGIAPEWLPSGRIRYLRGGDLYDIDPVSRAVRRLTTGAAAGYEWSGEGDAIVTARDIAGRPLLYDVSPGDRTLARIADVEAAEPTVSPDGSRIAFTHAEHAPDRLVLAVLDRASGAVTRLVSRRGAESIATPAWSPGGSRIAFATTRGLAVLRLADGRVTPVPGTRPRDGQPSWSPAGDRLVFSRPRGETVDLWTVAVGTGHADRLVRGGAWPAWSPDGRTIAYTTTGIADGYDIWTMPARGGRPRRLTTNGRSQLRFNIGARWSPDGAAIAYLTDAGNGGDDWKLVLIRKDGRKLRQLDNPGYLLGFDWAATPRG